MAPLEVKNVPHVGHFNLQTFGLRYLPLHDRAYLRKENTPACTFRSLLFAVDGGIAVVIFPLRVAALSCSSAEMAISGFCFIAEMIV